MAEKEFLKMVLDELNQIKPGGSLPVDKIAQSIEQQLKNITEKSDGF